MKDNKSIGIKKVDDSFLITTYQPDQKCDLILTEEEASILIDSLQHFLKLRSYKPDSVKEEGKQIEAQKTCDWCESQISTTELRERVIPAIPSILICKDRQACARRKWDAYKGN